MAGVKIPKHSQAKPHPDASVWSLVMHFSLLNSIQPRQLPCLAEDPQGKKVMCTSTKTWECSPSSAGMFNWYSSVYSMASIHGKCAISPHLGKVDPELSYWLPILLKWWSIIEDNIFQSEQFCGIIEAHTFQGNNYCWVLGCCQTKNT